MQRNVWEVWLFAVILMPYGCKNVAPSDEDAGDDANAGADLDVDTDGDADVDSDIDGDADTDTGTDADTDADTDVDTDADADGDSDSDSDSPKETDKGTGEGDSETPSDTGKGSEPPDATDTEEDTDSDNSGDTETASATVDGITDSEQLVDDACLEGYDSDSPALRIRSFVPVQPAGLSGSTFTTPVQEAFDEENIIYLLTLEGLDDPTATLAMGFGAGRSIPANGTYAFTDDPPPSALQVSLSGNGFTSSSSGENIILVFPFTSSTDLGIPVQEMVVTGTFTTRERCSIGEQLTDGPPSTWEAGGQIDGLITVEDAEAVTIQYLSFTFSLCAFLAHGLTGILTGSSSCSGDPASWNTPPDETTTDGDPAWRLIADYAATAVLLER